MAFTRAITRLPGAGFADGLTRVDLGRADVDLALAQHAAYRDALRDCGLDVTVLPAEVDAGQAVGEAGTGQAGDRAGERHRGRLSARP